MSKEVHSFNPTQMPSLPSVFSSKSSPQYALKANLHFFVFSLTGYHYLPVFKCHDEDWGIKGSKRWYIPNIEVTSKTTLDELRLALFKTGEEEVTKLREDLGNIGSSKVIADLLEWLKKNDIISLIANSHYDAYPDDKNLFCIIIELNTV